MPNRLKAMPWFLALSLYLVLASQSSKAAAPDFLWAKQLRYISTQALSLDSARNVFAVGSFYNTATFGTTNQTSGGDLDAFIAKLDTSGNFLWVKRAGGTQYDSANALSVDNAGNVYVAGYFQSTATFGTTNLTSSGGDDAFIAKLDANGNFLWAKQAGGTNNDFVRALSVDNAGNVYVAGYFQSTATFGTTNLTSSGGDDAFIAKLDANGNFLWAKQAGGINNDSASALSVDNAGNVYVTGNFYGTATFGTTNQTSGGDLDAFIAKLDTSGNFLWVKRAGGTQYDSANALSVDTAGNVYVAGSFEGSVIFGTNTLTATPEYNTPRLLRILMFTSPSWILRVTSSGPETEEGGVLTLLVP